MAKGTTVERTRRAFVPDEACLAKQVREPIFEPDLPIVDPHHHLWDHANHRYLLDELLAARASACSACIGTLFRYCGSAPFSMALQSPSPPPRL